MGWKIGGYPPYPLAARTAHEQGFVYVELVTDQEGKVIKTTTPTKTTHPILDKFTSEWARDHWQGPPNADVITFTLFRLM